MLRTDNWFLFARKNNCVGVFWFINETVARVWKRWARITLHTDFTPIICGWKETAGGVLMLFLSRIYFISPPDHVNCFPQNHTIISSWIGIGAQYFVFKTAWNWRIQPLFCSAYPTYSNHQAPWRRNSIFICLRISFFSHAFYRHSILFLFRISSRHAAAWKICAKWARKLFAVDLWLLISCGCGGASFPCGNRDSHSAEFNPFNIDYTICRTQLCM